MRLEISKYVTTVTNVVYYLPNTLLSRLTDAGLGSLQGELDAGRGSSLEALILSCLVVRLPGVETVDIVQSVDKRFLWKGCESCVVQRCNALHRVFKGMCGHLRTQRSHSRTQHRRQYIFLKSPPRIRHVISAGISFSHDCFSCDSN